MTYTGGSLYKRGLKDRILTWKVRVEDYGYTAHIITEFGQLNGKIQSVIENVTEGKQKRSVSEQAVKMAKAQEKAKKDEGYKSLEDLALTKIDGGWKQSSEEGQTYSLFDKALFAVLPKEDTDANGFLRPMLAYPIVKTVKGKTIDYWHEIQYPIAGEPKLDGVRCLIFSSKPTVADTLFGSLLNSTAISREGMNYDFATVKIREKLIKLFEENPGIILDGELYKHGLPQNQISGAVRTQGRYNPIFNTMEFHVYDVINTNTTYEHRRDYLEELNLLFPNAFVLNPSIKLINKEEVDTFEKESIENGYEGIMLKPYNGMYKPGKRTKAFFKVKRFQEEEFKIVGYELGTRGVQDLIFVLRHPNIENETFSAVATGTVAEKQRMFNNIFSLIGKQATVKFKDYTEYGTPNHGHVKTIRDYE